jgi:hypothetical protein
MKPETARVVYFDYHGREEFAKYKWMVMADQDPVSPEREIGSFRISPGYIAGRLVPYVDGSFRGVDYLGRRIGIEPLTPVGEGIEYDSETYVKLTYGWDDDVKRSSKL